MLNTVSNVIFVCSCFMYEGVEYIDRTQCRYVESRKQMLRRERVVKEEERIKRERNTVIIVEGSNNNIQIKY